MTTRSKPARIAAQALISGALVLAAALAPAHGPARAARVHAAYPPLVVFDGLSPFVRQFNINEGYGAQPGAVTQAIYEPLYLIDNVQYKQYPWLATAYSWSRDLKTLTFTIRHGVTWSDGVPFTARDVYYTMAILGKRYPALPAAGADQLGLWEKGSLNEATGVTMPAVDKVAITFKTADVTRFFNVAGLVPLPEHIWSKQKDPLHWANPAPVATGPFTRISNFTAQGFDMSRNPHYWQPGKPAFDTVRVVYFTSNDAANLAIEAGQVDWGGQAPIPNASRLYDARNPNFHHFYCPCYMANNIFFNDTKYPYSLVAFRQALSMAINRQVMNTNGDYGYFPPSDIQGISGPYPGWVDRTIPQTLAQYNPAAAKALLLKNGFTYQNGRLIDPHGHKVAFDIIPTISPLAQAQIIAQEFKGIGIDAGIKVLQFGDFLDRLQKGNFDVVDGWDNGGPNPYYYYEPLLSSRATAPLGTQVPESNYERWSNPQMDALFAQFRKTSDPQRQHQLINQIQRLFVRYLPIIPTTITPIPEEYNTTNYTGFPTQSDNYAYGTPFEFGFPQDTLLILTRVHPSH